MPDIRNDIIKNSYDGLNCIWMASGSIDFSLCEKDYICEDCPLDKIMRNLFSDDGRVGNINFNLYDLEFLDRIINKIENSSYDSRLIYFNNNVVVKHIFSNIYYLGLNPIFVSLLDNVTAIREYLKRVYFLKGQKILVIDGDWGSFTVSTPVNFMLLDKLNWKLEDLISKNWLALVLLNQQEIDDGKLSCCLWQKGQFKALKLLNDYKNCCLKINSISDKSAVKINSLFQLIGKDEYLKMLNCYCDE